MEAAMEAAMEAEAMEAATEAETAAEPMEAATEAAMAAEAMEAAWQAAEAMEVALDGGMAAEAMEAAMEAAMEVAVKDTRTAEAMEAVKHEKERARIEGLTSDISANERSLRKARQGNCCRQGMRAAERCVEAAATHLVNLQVILHDIIAGIFRLTRRWHAGGGGNDMREEGLLRHPRAWRVAHVHLPHQPLQLRQELVRHDSAQGWWARCLGTIVADLLVHDCDHEVDEVVISGGYHLTGLSHEVPSRHMILCKEHGRGGEYKSASSGLSMPSLFHRDVGSPRARCGHTSSIPPRRTYFPSAPPTEGPISGARGASPGRAARRGSAWPRTGREGRLRGPYVVGPEGGTLPSALWTANDAVEAPSPASREMSAGWKQV